MKNTKKTGIKPYVMIMIPVVILLLGCTTPGQHDLDEGRRLFASENWDESVQFFTKALEKYPDNNEVKLLLKGAKMRSSQAHMIKGEAFMKNGYYDMAIGEFQMSIAMNPGNRKPFFLIQKAKNMKTALFYIKQGRNMLKSRQYKQGRESLLKALELDSGNEEAKKLLSYFEKEKESQPGFRLKLKNNNPVSLKFKNTPLISVFEVLSTLTGINFIFDKDLKESNVTLFMTDVPFERFIDVLLKTHGLSAKTIDEKTMLIYPDTSVKNKEYQELVIRTFYLANIDAKKMASILTKVLKTKNIIINEKLNAIVLRAPEDVIKLAARVIEANDMTEAEVLLNVEILEVSRSKEKQFGIEIEPSSISVGIGEGNSKIDENASFVGKASVKALSGLTSQEVYLSVPRATLNFLKKDGDTKILASPQIRVKNRQNSKILIGERVPLRTNRRVDTTGAITYDFQYFEIGVKLNATPVINMNGQITIKLKLEISALGPNVGTADDPQFSILTRTAQSIVTVLDGEAIVIGGLIRDEERQSMRSIPYIDQLPLLGKIFSGESTENRRTDIIMAITPVIIRELVIPDTNVSQMWSGSENKFSTSKPFEEIFRRKTKYADKPEKKIHDELKSLDEKDEENDKVILPSIEINNRIAEPKDSLIFK